MAAAATSPGSDSSSPASSSSHHAERHGLVTRADQGRDRVVRLDLPTQPVRRAQRGPLGRPPRRAAQVLLGPHHPVRTSQPGRENPRIVVVAQPPLPIDPPRQGGADGLLDIVTDVLAHDHGRRVSVRQSVTSPIPTASTPWARTSRASAVPRRPARAARRLAGVAQPHRDVLAGLGDLAAPHPGVAPGARQPPADAFLPRLVGGDHPVREQRGGPARCEQLRDPADQGRADPVTRQPAVAVVVAFVRTGPAGRDDERRVGDHLVERSPATGSSSEPSRGSHRTPLRAAVVARVQCAPAHVRHGHAGRMA